MRRSTAKGHRDRRSVLALSCVLLALLVVAPNASARVLQFGMIGPDVDNLNAQLQKIGFLPPGPLPTSYTQATRDGVFAFQKYKRIDISGVAGPLTRRMLSHAHRPKVHHGGRRAQVDLKRQIVFWVAENGRVLRTVSVSTGMHRFATPKGHFHIFRKEMWSWSHPYKVFMAYSSYFSGGAAFHEGDLSSKVDTHGCIHVPMEFAKDFYHWLRKGTAVWIS